MINPKELQQILKIIETNIALNRNEDIDTLKLNLEKRVYSLSTEPLSDNMKHIITEATIETLEACHSLCINHDAEVIKAIVNYINSSH